MKKIEEIMHSVDVQVDRKVKALKPFIQKYFSIFSITLLSVLLVIFLFRVFRDRPQALTLAINDDLSKIDQVLTQIDKDSNIISIHSGRSYLDFFTVAKFVGSTVGCLNVAFPERWKGPYLHTNPTIQGRMYEIVHTKEGYFVVPGHGVKLPNGKIMGKDIQIKKDTSINEMLKKDGLLFYQGHQLGFKIQFKIGDWNATHISPQTIDKVNEALKEFNDALPFAQHHGKGSIQAA